MSEHDLIEYPAQPGEFGRRPLIEALIAAGSPRTNSLTRLKPEQQILWDGWQDGLAGYNPADNPADESQPLAHVRGAAADINPTPTVVAALERVGLVRPYWYEPWHWQVPGDVRRFALVTTRPIFTNTQEDTDMMINIQGKAKVRIGGLYLFKNGKASVIQPAIVPGFPTLTDETAIGKLFKAYPG